MIKKITHRVKNYLKLRKEKKILRKLKPEEAQLIYKIRTQHLTYLSRMKLVGMTYIINDIQKAQLKGMFVEAGCALGGSSILIAKQKQKDTKLNVYDVFGMIPAPTEEDTQDVHERYQVIADGKSKGIGGKLYYGYEENLYDKVIDNLKNFEIDLEKENVNLIKGLVQETMNIEEPVVFAHIDVDWYDPVKTCLQQIWPNLVVGGSIVLDDYHHWGGCRKATDEFFKGFPGQFSIDHTYGSVIVTRTK